MIPGYFPNRALFYLQHEFEQRKARRPYYSYRAFARDLQLSPSTLNEFLKGKTGFSRGRAEKVGGKLGLPATHLEHFCDLVDLEFHPQETQRNQILARISKRTKDPASSLALDHFALIADWYHFAILEILTIDSRVTDAVIARHLKVPLPQIRKAVSRLVGLNLLSLDGDQRRPQESQTLVGVEQPSEAIREFHRQILQLARTAIDSQPLAERDLSSNFFAFNSQDLPALKKDLQDAVFQIMVKYNSVASKDSVYMLSYQLFSIFTEKAIR